MIAQQLTLASGERIVCPDHPDAGLVRPSVPGQYTDHRREVRCADCGQLVWCVPDDDTWPAGTEDALPN